MSPILVVDSSDIHEGKLEEVKAGVEELVAFVEANEAEPLAYDIYFDAAGTLMTVVQIHPDAASLERHLSLAGPLFRRFADLLTLARVDVYGRAERSRARADPRESAAARKRAGRSCTNSMPASPDSPAPDVAGQRRLADDRGDL